MFFFYSKHCPVVYNCLSPFIKSLPPPPPQLSATPASGIHTPAGAKACGAPSGGPPAPQASRSTTWCQTELSLPPELPQELEEALRPFCNFTQVLEMCP